jgi:hypothetical protein
MVLMPQPPAPLQWEWNNIECTIRRAVVDSPVSITANLAAGTAGDDSGQRDPDETPHDKDISGKYFKKFELYSKKIFN